MHTGRTVLSLLLLLLGTDLAAQSQLPGPGKAAANQPDPTIPLRTLLSPPVIQMPLLSPDGSMISGVVPLDGVPNLFVAPAGDPKNAKPVTHLTGRGIQASDVSGNANYRWTGDNGHLLYLRDNNGDEKWNLYIVDIRTGDSRNLTPFKGSQVRVVGTSLGQPDAVLVGINNRDPRWHDIYRLTLSSGKLELVEKNDRFAFFVADNDLKLRIAGVPTKDGGVDLFKSGGDGKWSSYFSLPEEDAQAMKQFGFDRTNRSLYAYESRDRNTVALAALEPDTGKARILGEDRKVDVANVLVHPGTHELQAYSTYFTRMEWHVLDQKLQPDFDYLSHLSEGDLKIDDQSRDGRFWLVHYTLSDAPEAYFLYDRDARKGQKLFVATPQLEGLPLSKMYPFVVKSRDGFDLVTYISVPRWEDTRANGHPAKPIPMIVVVHGGPSDERPEYAFAPLLQWLTNRGYAVLVANFRGTPGFGKAFLNAQNLEWGGKMNDDLLDQIRWAVENGFAQKDKIALLGGSYGGYATLVGMTSNPDVYACGVDVVGPANLETFMATIPPYWSLDHLARRVGDPRTEEGKALLKARSPINFVGRVKKPMLIGQGANDSRVPQGESDRMVAALNGQGVSVTYLLYPDEGHGFLRTENNRSFFAVTEIFLGQCLGGRYEQLGDALAGSSVQVPVGAKYIPGLKAALEAEATKRAGKSAQP
jgi:dipeptidyl aminopeptidase/acylaminoacyl peptidase